MSYERKEEYINQIPISKEQTEIQVNSMQENKVNDDLKLKFSQNLYENIDASISLGNLPKIRESKFSNQANEPYEDINTYKKDSSKLETLESQSESKSIIVSTNKEAYSNNFTNFSNQGNFDSNNTYVFAAPNKDLSFYENHNKTNYQNTHKNIQEQSNKSYCHNNYYYNNQDTANQWKKRFSTNSSLFQKISYEDDSLVQEHIHNQKKKDSLDVSNYKSIDIDITFNDQKIFERSEFTYFSEITDLEPQLKTNLDTLDFKLMTPIQREVIKFIRDGKDVMGCSQTGSGKTIAFLLPIISRILSEMPSPLANNPPSPRVLILIPTRELAEQIWTEARKLVKETGIVVNKIYGGVPHDEQLEKMYSGCDILVATPGRLLDFIKSNNLSLKNVKYLIMDEADRMLDMGFQPQLMKIAFGTDLMAKEMRQNLLFSATFTEEIKNISKNFMNNDYYFIQTIFDKNPSKNIKQELYYAPESEKIDKLHGILKVTSGSIIIFVETKFGVDNLYLALKKYGHRVSCIHGDKKQQQRQEAIKRFSKGQISILIATDIASRGLDFPKVTHVINFDLPTNIEDYIHRIGRTGRCGNTGTAISFVNEYNKPIIRNLYYFMKKNHQKINDWFENLYKNCKDINVNIFDRIPKKPKRSLGMHNRYPNTLENNSSSFANTSTNFNINPPIINGDYTMNNSYNNMNNKNFSNNPAFTNNFNNFSQPVSSSNYYSQSSNSSYDRREKQEKYDRYDRHEKYDKNDKYESRKERDLSSNKYSNSSNTSNSYKKTSNSTNYNSSGGNSNNYSNKYESNKDSSRDSNKYNSSTKYESDIDNINKNPVSNNNRNYTNYSRETSNSKQSTETNSNYQFLGKKHSYQSSANAENEDSNYQRNRKSRFNDNNYASHEESKSQYHGKDQNKSYNNTRNYNRNIGSNFQSLSSADANNSFYSGNTSYNNFAAFPVPNAYPKSDTSTISQKNSNNNSNPNQNLNMMFPYMSGAPMNYNTYPGINYTNFYNQNKGNTNFPENSSNNNNTKNISSNDYEEKLTNKIKNTNNNDNSSNSAAGGNLGKQTNNPLMAYYNYASYAAGFGVNYSGYDPYNGQVNSYSYEYSYPENEKNINNPQSNMINNLDNNKSN